MNNNLLTEYINSLYDGMAAWLNQSYINDCIVSKVESRYITYHMQTFLVPTVFNFHMTTNKYTGSVVEIGCAEGNSSNIFSSLAKANGYKYVALDPWNGQQEGNETKYRAFLKQIQNNVDSAVVIRKQSHDISALEQLKTLDVKCAFIDGLHTFEACYGDIKNMVESGAEVLCVDDLLLKENRDAGMAWNEAVRGGLIKPIEVKNVPSLLKVIEFKDYRFAVSA